jgi:hypothetical protein
MHLRSICFVSVLAALFAASAGVARALDFDNEDPHPPRAEIGLLYHYGNAYRARLAVRGGVGPLTWSGALPRGLKLSKSGTITGAPASAGTFRLRVRVRDSLGASSTKTLLLRVQ